MAKKCDLADKYPKVHIFVLLASDHKLNFVGLVLGYYNLGHRLETYAKCGRKVPKVVLGVGTGMLVRNYRDKREIGVLPDATSNEQPI